MSFRVIDDMACFYFFPPSLRCESTIYILSTYFSIADDLFCFTSFDISSINSPFYIDACQGTSFPHTGDQVWTMIVKATVPSKSLPFRVRLNPSLIIMPQVRSPSCCRKP